MSRLVSIMLVLLMSFCVVQQTYANENDENVEHIDKTENFVVKDFILEHVSDSYEWHLTKLGKVDIAIPLPIIIYSDISGWHFFLSNKLHHGALYEGLFISINNKYNGKIVELDAEGHEIRPLDLSITKVVLSLLINSLLLIVLVMWVARSYKKGIFESKKGFLGFMEMFIMSINNDVIKPCVGPDYKIFSPYLLTVFFFIFINNIMGLIPIFPGGANVTGNIAVTFVLALITFLVINLFGTKLYWKEIFWPDVPMWLKFPIPLMPVIELVSIITKPFALMIRLFANILAGHSIVLGLTCLIFVTVNLGKVMNTEMTVVAIVFSVFISMVEILVAYIQAYVFTMLSAVFIGLARINTHH